MSLRVVSVKRPDGSPILPSLSITATLIVYFVFGVNSVISVLVLPSVTSLVPSLSEGILKTLYSFAVIVLSCGPFQLIVMDEDVVLSDIVGVDGLVETKNDGITT